MPQPGPDYPAQLTKRLMEMFADAEQQILTLIAARVAMGIDAVDWQVRQLNEAHRLRIEVAKLAAALKAGSEAEIARAIDAAYSFGVARAGSQLSAAGTVDAIAFGGIDLDAMSRLADTAKKSLGSVLLPIQSQASRIYSDVVGQTASRMLAGVGTRRQVAAMALKDWAQRGVTGFVDKAGRNWSLQSYAEMTARTSAAQAMNAGHTDRLVETGHDLVMVSDAPEECYLCRPYEGKVFSLTGATPAGSYSKNEQSYTVQGMLQSAIDGGLHHPNCRHREVAFLPGFTRRMKDTADPEGDKLRQSQRYKERRVRQLKREAAVANEIDPVSGKAANVKLRAYQKDFKAWREINGRKNLAYRTSLTAR